MVEGDGRLMTAQRPLEQASTIGQVNEGLAELQKRFSQHPKEVSQAHETVADSSQHGVLAVPVFRVVKLIIAQPAVTVPANDGHIVMVVPACDMVQL